MDLDEIYSHASEHKDEILISEICGCFFCESRFPPAEITKWHEEEQTALCPKCGLDAVIGSASSTEISKKTLNDMNKAYFK